MLIAIICLAVVCVIEGIWLAGLTIAQEESEELMHKIADIVIKDKMKESMDNLHKGLENLFNPKDEPKNNVKKTNTHRKTK